jgi:hypothetical protein
MKALEVSIEGKVIGVYVPPDGEVFAATVGNIPRTYMRAHVMSFTLTESWQWQLPDLEEGQVISFRMIEAEPGTGVPPQYVTTRDPEDVSEMKRLAAEAYAQAMQERDTEG